MSEKELDPEVARVLDRLSEVCGDGRTFALDLAAIDLGRMVGENFPRGAATRALAGAAKAIGLEKRGSRGRIAVGLAIGMAQVQGISLGWSTWQIGTS